MTVTAIHPPTKLLDLDAVVRSAAVLTGAGLVGVITAGPAKLALLQMTGGGGPAIDLSVDSPQELALLSKDVAVVRSNDGSLWAIGDLHGSPRAKLVGRDARALVMRPHGESALALMADGSGGAITLSKNEVSLRPFGVRGGALRACYVSENVTHVVAEGEGGGQLRIHPGATPEQGTSVKATLPAEAKELDQVRGSMALTVVWRRGMAAICLVTGGPSKLSPAMAELDGRPADVAVLEDALLVAFADGRVALYDGAAVAGAAQGKGGPLAATAVISPPARGKPRVVVVAGTSKIPAALWIGTTSGEVLRAALARDGERVEELPPPKSAAPKEDLRAEVAALKQALADAEAAREAEAERARALEAAQAEAAGAGEGEREAHAAAIEALKSEHAAAIEAQKTEHGSAIEALKGEHAAALDARSAEHVSALDARNAEHAGALDARNAEHTGAVDALKGEHAAALEAQSTAHAGALDAQKTEHASAIDALKGEHARAIDAQRAEHTAAIDAQKIEHAGALAKLTSEHAAAIDAQKAEHTALLDAGAAKHAGEIDALKAEHAAAVEAAKVEHAASLAARDEAHAREVSERDTLVSSMQAELDTARKEIEAVTARASAAEERLSQKTREHVELGAELDALRAELAEERAKLERDFVKWGGHTVSLDKARGAVDAMLSRAQGVFGKRGRE